MKCHLQLVTAQVAAGWPLEHRKISFLACARGAQTLQKIVGRIFGRVIGSAEPVESVHLVKVQTLATMAFFWWLNMRCLWRQGLQVQESRADGNGLASKHF